MPSATYLLNLAANGVIEGLIIALAALSMTLVFGIARFPNAATGDYLTLGAYTAIVAEGALGLPMVFNAVAAMVVVSGAAVLSYFLVFRRLESGSFVTSLVASVGIAFFLRSILIFLFGYDQRVFQVPIVRAISLGPIRVVPTDLWLAAVALGTLALVFAGLHLTPIGKRMRAVADNPELARVSGIGTVRIMVILWVAVGCVSAIAGVLLGVKTVVMPEMGWDLLLPAFAATILGGVGSPVGAVLGGIVLGIVQEVSTPFVGFTYKIGLAFFVLLVILLVRPRGFFGRLELIR